MRYVWYVVSEDPSGAWPTLWDTEDDALRYARFLYPKESIERREARIFYRPVHTMDEFLGLTHKQKEKA